ncbi:Rho GTPase-activating protein 6 [Zea mays]|uniref:Rho GTPase-activating protein 6 n=1 Tax=Zea mays TaxID=4577 RepID=A0A317YLE9_MAIZE|nr:Rho GTPase-activating protein 6 [Zea mays]
MKHFIYRQEKACQERRMAVPVITTTSELGLILRSLKTRRLISNLNLRRRYNLFSRITKNHEKENTVLQANLEKRKEALHKRRVALEKEVIVMVSKGFEHDATVKHQFISSFRYKKFLACVLQYDMPSVIGQRAVSDMTWYSPVENLRDQLLKERSLRASLESGLMNMRRGQVSFPSTIDTKTKADLEEVAAVEADIMNLKQKESGGAPSSALAKLTTRLNFLKERRALLASEMQNLDLGRSQAQRHTAPPKAETPTEK